MPRHRPDDEDETHNFLMHADDILKSSRFIVTSLPNAEPFAVERALRQLHAIRHVLLNFDDPWTTPEDIDIYMNLVAEVSVPLQAFHEAPPPPRNVGTSTVMQGGRGRPAYQLDLPEALRLHSLGNTWEGVSHAMGVSRRTIYYHLERAGLSTQRRKFTEIDDEDLDERVSEISLKHPLAGTSIVMGHLEAMGIHLPSERVQECLRRVDAMGVLARYVCWLITFKNFFLIDKHYLAGRG